MSEEYPKSGKCQNCQSKKVQSPIDEVDGKPFWLCKTCKCPLPHESYNLSTAGITRKAWGAVAYDRYIFKKQYW